MDKKALIFKIIRIFTVSVVLCAVAAVIFQVYAEQVPKALAALEEKGKMENTIWVVQHFTPMVCISGLIAVLYVIYRFIKLPYLQMQSEKGFVMLVCAAFTYGVILPYVIKQSWGCFAPVPDGVEDVKSIFENTVSWFVVQSIPFMITISYHFLRAGRKPEEIEEGAKQNEQETK